MVLNTTFSFKDKDLARRYFLELRQNFLDWNFSETGSDEFKQLESAIDAKVKEHSNA
jgi:V/A-type H+-transporting ATPase subunit A